MPTVTKVENQVPLYPKAWAKRVGIYARVSTTRIAQLRSMAAQVSQLTQFILSRRDWALVDVYMDFDSASGSKMRDNFYRMIDDAKAGRLDYIVTKSIQRFGRNTEENLTAMRTLLDSGVVVYFQIEGFASNDPEAELEAALFSTLASADNASRREDRLWGRQRRIENGTSGLFRRPCYGYTLADNGILVIDKNKADVVRKIYDSYLSGMSISGIKKMLEEEKIPSPSGGKTWAARTIDRKRSIIVWGKIKRKFLDWSRQQLHSRVGMASGFQEKAAH